MTRFAAFRVVAAMVAGLMAMVLSPAFAQGSYGSYEAMINATNAEIEQKLQLSGEEKTKTDAVLQKYAQERLQAFNDLGIKWGEKPSFSTLLELKKKMDGIASSEQTELSKFLSDNQMYTIHEVVEEWQGKFTKALLG